MGDIFHTFPAITDLKNHFPNIEIDWVVEDSFKEIAAWHPAVHRVIPIHLRRWMKARNRATWREFKTWRNALQEQQYDLVVDAQGLLKSALIAKLINKIMERGKRSRAEAIVAGPEALARLIAQDLDKWRRVAKQTGIRGE